MGSDTIWIAVGLGGIVIGLCLVLLGRARLRRSVSGAQTTGISGVTVAVMGLGLATVGYHLAVWNLPGSWKLLAAPRSLWPIVVGAVVIGIGLSLATDALDRRQR